MMGQFRFTCRRAWITPLVCRYSAEDANDCGVAAWVSGIKSLRGLEDVDRGMGCSSEIDVTTLCIVGSREVKGPSLNESFTGCKKPHIMEIFRNALL